MNAKQLKTQSNKLGINFKKIIDPAFSKENNF